MSKYVLDMVAGDTGPPVIFDIYQADGKPYNDMATGSARFYIKNANTGSVTNSAHNDCQNINPINQCQYEFQTGDVPVEGTYTCDLEITDSFGKVQTEYSYVQINVRAKND